MEEIGNDTFEVKSIKKPILLIYLLTHICLCVQLEHIKRRYVDDVPRHLAFYVLQLAKLRMVKLFYNFFDTYMDRQDFRYMQMDTDR